MMKFNNQYQSKTIKFSFDDNDFFQNIEYYASDRRKIPSINKNITEIRDHIGNKSIIEEVFSDIEVSIKN